MNHWDWLAILAVGGAMGLLWSISKQLEKLNEQIGNVRHLLNQINDRQLGL